MRRFSSVHAPFGVLVAIPFNDVGTWTGQPFADRGRRISGFAGKELRGKIPNP